MRRTWVALGWLGAGLLLAVGCKTPEPNLKPPPHPEELTVPPQDDSRYSKPPAFPDNTINQYDRKKKDPSADGTPRFGAGPGGAGMGGMGGP